MNIFRRHGVKRESKYKSITILLPQLYSDLANDCFQDISKSNENTVLRAVKFKEIFQIKIITTLKHEVCITRKCLNNFSQLILEDLVVDDTDNIALESGPKKIWYEENPSRQELSSNECLEVQ